MKRHLTIAIALAGALAGGGALAQANQDRGNVPPGAAGDGSRAPEGAIKGGSMQRLPIEERVERCDSLSGSLREQCLRDAMNPSAGASRTPSPSDSEAAKPRSPTAPPPQNPR